MPPRLLELLWGSSKSSTRSEVAWTNLIACLLALLAMTKRRASLERKISRRSLVISLSTGVTLIAIISTFWVCPIILC
jgi:hypothetical protein